MHPKDLLIEDYTYELPEERIAFHPAHPRDSAKLLVYREDGIREDSYKNLGRHLPKGSTLIFNDTKVIKSRILFPKETGAIIEIFCLEPYGEYADFERVFNLTGSATWKCMIGKAGKWKKKYLQKKLFLDNREITLTAGLIERLEDAYVVRFTWTPGSIKHGKIMNAAGVTPLPPYIKRTATAEDEKDYQTVYSEHKGSVAAPTAGLHFTPELLEGLRKQDISTLFTTLHVGAGTFKPVKTKKIEGHVMHGEWMNITTEFLKQLVGKIDKSIIGVGTTAARTLESIYWMGNKLLEKGDIEEKQLRIRQWETYETERLHGAQESITALIRWMEARRMTQLLIETDIIIAPGYSFKIIDGLITNFHMSQSTLLLLIAALVGEDWKEIYRYALDHNFRFLSYGDGSLLLP